MTRYYIDIDSGDLIMLGFIIGPVLVAGTVFLAAWRWAGPGAAIRSLGVGVAFYAMSVIDIDSVDLIMLGFIIGPVLGAGTVFLAAWRWVGLDVATGVAIRSLGFGVVTWAMSVIDIYTGFKTQYPLGFQATNLLALYVCHCLTTILYPVQSSDPEKRQEDMNSSEIQSAKINKVNKVAKAAAGPVIVFVGEAIDGYTGLKSQSLSSYWAMHVLLMIAYAYLTTLFESSSRAANTNVPGGNKELTSHSHTEVHGGNL